MRTNFKRQMKRFEVKKQFVPKQTEDRETQVLINRGVQANNNNAQHVNIVQPNTNSLQRQNSYISQQIAENGSNAAMRDPGKEQFDYYKPHIVTIDKADLNLRFKRIKLVHNLKENKPSIVIEIGDGDALNAQINQNAQNAQTDQIAYYFKADYGNINNNVVITLKKKIFKDFPWKWQIFYDVKLRIPFQIKDVLEWFKTELDFSKFKALNGESIAESLVKVLENPDEGEMLRHSVKVEKLYNDDRNYFHNIPSLMIKCFKNFHYSFPVTEAYQFYSLGGWPLNPTGLLSFTINFDSKNEEMWKQTHWLHSKIENEGGKKVMKQLYLVFPSKSNTSLTNYCHFSVSPGKLGYGNSKLSVITAYYIGTKNMLDDFIEKNNLERKDLPNSLIKKPEQVLNFLFREQLRPSIYSEKIGLIDKIEKDMANKGETDNEVKKSLTELLENHRAYTNPLLFSARLGYYSQDQVSKDIESNPIYELIKLNAAALKRNQPSSLSSNSNNLNGKKNNIKKKKNK